MITQTNLVCQECGSRVFHYFDHVHVKDAKTSTFSVIEINKFICYCRGLNHPDSYPECWKESKEKNDVK